MAHGIFRNRAYDAGREVQAAGMSGETPVRGAGFGIRALAHVVDVALVTLLGVMLMVPLLLRSLQTGTMGVPLWVELPVDLAMAVGVILLWRFTQTTPGKKLLGLQIVDWRTGGRPGWGQLTVRYLGYLVAYVPFPLRLLTLWWPGLEASGMWQPFFQSWLMLMPLGLGFLWVFIDPWHRGWHDLMSGTVTTYIRREEMGGGDRLTGERRNDPGRQQDGPTEMVDPALD